MCKQWVYTLLNHSRLKGLFYGRRVCSFVCGIRSVNTDPLSVLYDILKWNGSKLEGTL